MVTLYNNVPIIHLLKLTNNEQFICYLFIFVNVHVSSGPLNVADTTFDKG